MESKERVVDIEVAEPYDFRYTLAYYRRRAGELVDATEGDVYRRLLDLGEELALVEVRASEYDDRLRLTVLFGNPSSLPAAAEAIRRAFGMDDRLEHLYAFMQADAVLRGLHNRLRGLRLVRTQSPFEALIWAVIGQQINLTFAFRLKSMLVRAYGQAVDFEGRSYWAFPLATRLATADEDRLAATGLGRRKASTIVGVAREIASGRLDLAALRTLPRRDAEARLTALPGIGPWTAHYTLLRGLGDFGAFPLSDLGLRAAVGRLYDLGGMAPMSLMRELGDCWGEWRGYVAFYLWNTHSERAD